MSSSAVYKWQTWCATESAWFYTWSELNTEPTVCSNNNAHTITAGTGSIVDKIEVAEVKIKENDTATGGYYQVDQFEIIAAASTTTTTSYINSDYAFNAYSVSFQTEEAHRGDTMDITISPNTIVGVITGSVSVGATVITVSSTVISYMKKGFRVILADGTNTDNCGVVKSINTATSQITVSTATTHSFSPATPTYVKMTVAYTRTPLKLGAPMLTCFGAGKIGGSYVPISTNVTIVYINNTNVEKRLIVYVETDY